MVLVAANEGAMDDIVAKWSRKKLEYQDVYSVYVDSPAVPYARKQQAERQTNIREYKHI
jgi:hypothetical protein